MKAILILDEMPEKCEDCDLFYTGDFGRSCQLVDIKNSKKPSYCPLKEVPERKDTISQVNLAEENKDIVKKQDIMEALEQVESMCPYEIAPCANDPEGYEQYVSGWNTACNALEMMLLHNKAERKEGK